MFETHLLMWIKDFFKGYYEALPQVSLHQFNSVQLYLYSAIYNRIVLWHFTDIDKECPRATGKETPLW